MFCNFTYHLLRKVVSSLSAVFDKIGTKGKQKYLFRYFLLNFFIDIFQRVGVLTLLNINKLVQI